MRVFLLEDDEAIGIGLSYSLENEGYSVVLSKTIAEAKRIIDEQDFSLYILDINLPDGSGYDICRLVKEKGDFPVIFLTAYDDEVNVVMGLDIVGVAMYYSVRKLKNDSIVETLKTEIN